MSINDTFKIGPFTYTILKRDGKRFLVSWTESTGIYQEKWLIMRQIPIQAEQSQNLKKAA